MRRFKQLTPQDRDRIYQFYQGWKTQAEIAKDLRRNKSTINRELKRNWLQIFDEYLPDTAQRKADRRKVLDRKRHYLERFPGLKAMSWPASRTAGPLT